MFKCAAILILIGFVATASLSSVMGDDTEQWNKTTVIKELHFCAFILRDFLDREQETREVYILMAPDDVAEQNLYLLFKVVSQRFPNPKSLRVWVDTYVEQLGLLATGRMVTVSPSEEEAKRIGTTPMNSPDAQIKAKKTVLQAAYYRRTKEVELFRYNPNYPDPGARTVILRGKE